MSIYIQVTGPSKAYGGEGHCLIRDCTSVSSWNRRMAALPEIITTRMLILKAAGEGVQIRGMGMLSKTGSTETYALHNMRLTSYHDENFYSRQTVAITLEDGSIFYTRI